MNDPRQDCERAELIREHRAARREARAGVVLWLLPMGIFGLFALATADLWRLGWTVAALLCLYKLWGEMIDARDETKTIRILQTGLQRWGARTFSVIVVSALVTAVMPPAVNYFGHRTPQQVAQDFEAWRKQLLPLSEPWSTPSP